MNRQKSYPEDDNLVTGVNVTPLVDVCLVLVIIFMVTTPLLNQSSLAVSLPKARTSEGEETSNVTITITDKERWAVNEREVDLNQLEKILAGRLALIPDRLVIIKADHSSRHRDLLAAMAAARRAGARSITIATEQK